MFAAFLMLFRASGGRSGRFSAERSMGRLVRDMTRSINIVAWPAHQRWKVSDEDQRTRRNNKLHWRKGKSLAPKICDTFDKSALKNSL